MPDKFQRLVPGGFAEASIGFCISMVDVALLGRALSSTTRLRILSVVGTGPVSVGEVARRVAIPHALASYHLGRLYEAHVVVFERAGRRRLYTRSEEGFECLARPLPRVA